MHRRRSSAARPYHDHHHAGKPRHLTRRFLTRATIKSKRVSISSQLASTRKQSPPAPAAAVASISPKRSNNSSNNMRSTARMASVSRCPKRRPSINDSSESMRSTSRSSACTRSISRSSACTRSICRSRKSTRRPLQLNRHNSKTRRATTAVAAAIRAHRHDEEGQLEEEVALVRERRHVLEAVVADCRLVQDGEGCPIHRRVSEPSWLTRSPERAKE